MGPGTNFQYFGRVCSWESRVVKTLGEFVIGRLCKVGARCIFERKCTIPGESRESSGRELLKIHHTQQQMERTHAANGKSVLKKEWVPPADRSADLVVYIFTIQDDMK